MVLRAILVGKLALLAVSVARAGEGEWSRFRGPNGGGISNATTVPIRWTESDYNWKVTLPGPGHSSPVVWDERVMVTCGDPETATRTVMCLDATSGHTLWRRDYPSKTFRQHRDNGYATATPAVDAEGLVLTWTTPDQVLLLALDLDGREVWRRDLGPFVGVQGSGSSPILFRDLAVLANDQEDPSLIPGHKTDPPAAIGKSFLIAVDRKTGRPRWQTERRTSFSSYSTPCIYHPENGPPELIFTSAAQGITAIDPTNGKVNWEYGQPFLDRAISSPIIASGLVVAGHGAGMRGSRYIAVHPGASQAGREPSLAYEVRRAIPLVPTPLYKDGRLFFWTDDGVVSCLQAADGKVLWQERVGGAFFSSPVCVDNRLYCISKAGEVVVVAASDKFELLSRIPLGEPSLSGGHKENFDASRAWSCCSGTRPQAAADYADLVYFHDRDDLYVNLFTPATVRWSIGGIPVVVSQTTRFPEESGTELTVHAKQPIEFGMKIRLPRWLDGSMTAQLNGQRIALSADARHWVGFRRTWADGDRLSVTLPMALHPCPFDPAKVYPTVVLYGPLVLAFRAVEPKFIDKIDLVHLDRSLVPAEGESLTWRVVADTAVLAKPYYAYKEDEPYWLYLDPSARSGDSASKIIFRKHWGRSPAFRFSELVGATAEYVFEGTGVRWRGYRFDDGGKAEVTIDGQVVATVDQYGPGRHLPFEWSHGGLTPGKHTIRVKVLGEKSADSKGHFINVRDFEALQ